MDKLTNFRLTLDELKKFVSMPIENDRDRAGIIQAFEFTYEQSWKAIQKIAGEQGASIGSPKAAFAFAMQNHWIDPKDEPLWLQLMKDRNLTSHTYKEENAKTVLTHITENYLAMFSSLLDHLNKQL